MKIYPDHSIPYYIMVYLQDLHSFIHVNSEELGFSLKEFKSKMQPSMFREGSDTSWTYDDTYIDLVLDDNYPKMIKNDDNSFYIVPENHRKFFKAFKLFLSDYNFPKVTFIRRHDDN